MRGGGGGTIPATGISRPLHWPEIAETLWHLGSPRIKWQIGKEFTQRIFKNFYLREPDREGDRETDIEAEAVEERSIATPAKVNVTRRQLSTCRTVYWESLCVMAGNYP